MRRQFRFWITLVLIACTTLCGCSLPVDSEGATGPHQPIPSPHSGAAAFPELVLRDGHGQPHVIQLSNALTDWGITGPANTPPSRIRWPDPIPLPGGAPLTFSVESELLIDRIDVGYFPKGIDKAGLPLESEPIPVCSREPAEKPCDGGVLRLPDKLDFSRVQYFSISAIFDDNSEGNRVFVATWLLVIAPG